MQWTRRAKHRYSSANIRLATAIRRASVENASLTSVSGRLPAQRDREKAGHRYPDGHSTMLFLGQSGRGASSTTFLSSACSSSANCTMRRLCHDLPAILDEARRVSDKPAGCSTRCGFDGQCAWCGGGGIPALHDTTSAPQRSWDQPAFRSLPPEARYMVRGFQMIDYRFEGVNCCDAAICDAQRRCGAASAFSNVMQVDVQR